MTSKRKQEIEDAHELLRTIRPDKNKIIKVRIIVWSLAIVAVMLFVYVNLLMKKIPQVFFSSTIILLFFLLFYCLHVAINTHSVILTEKGLIQKWNQAFYWKDIEEYRWIPSGKKYFILRVFPSNSMPLLMQINNTRGGFGLIYEDYIPKIEDLFKQNGIREQ